MQLFYAVFFAVFAWLLINVVFFNIHFSYKPATVVLLAAVWLLFFYLLWRFCVAAGPWLQKKAKNERVALLLFFALLCCVQLFFFTQVASHPARDLNYVYTSAYNYTIAGIIENPYLDYLYKYPNNMPLTALLQFLFRAFYRLTGSVNFWAVGVLFNVFCIDLGYIFSYLSAKKMWGKEAGFFILFLLLFNLPLQFYITVFYTDTAVIFCAPALFYTFLCLGNSGRAKNTAMLLTAAGLLAGFGMQLKYSVVIGVIAFCIALLLKKPGLAAVATAAFLAGFVLWGAVFNSFTYTHVLNKEIAADEATPYLAWVMMGLGGDGAHNPTDNYIVWNWQTEEERVAFVKEEITRRLDGYGVWGYMCFLRQKGIRSFGSGNAEVASYVGEYPVRQTALADAVYYANGENGNWLDYLMQGYHIAVFCLVAAGAVLALKQKNYIMLLPYIAIFGLYLFLLLWEAGQRYLLQYTAFYLLAAVYCARHLFKYCYKKLNLKAKSPEKTNI